MAYPKYPTSHGGYYPLDRRRNGFCERRSPPSHVPDKLKFFTEVRPALAWEAVMTLEIVNSTLVARTI